MTYEIKTKTAFLELASTGEQQEVITFLNDAIANEMLVSIQASLINDEEVYLYGMYDNTVEWVSDYNSNGGMWEYSHPAELLAEFTKVEDTIYPVSNNVEDFFDVPEYIYGNFNHLQSTIDKARKSLIDLNADIVKFYYRAELISDLTFLNSDDINDVIKLQDCSISWLSPEVVVSIFDTKIVWNDKHNNNQMWITVETDYDTKFQSFHDRALNNSSTLA